MPDEEEEVGTVESVAGMAVDDLLDNIDADKIKLNGLREALEEFQTGDTWDELQHDQKVGVTESIKLLTQLDVQFNAILGS